MLPQVALLVCLVFFLKTQFAASSPKSETTETILKNTA